MLLPLLQMLACHNILRYDIQKLKGRVSMKRAVLCLILALLICWPGLAHPGRTDAQGGHWNHSTGEYHFHDGRYAGQDRTSSGGTTDIERLDISKLIKPTPTPAPVHAGEWIFRHAGDIFLAIVLSPFVIFMLIFYVLPFLYLIASPFISIRNYIRRRRNTKRIPAPFNISIPTDDVSCEPVPLPPSELPAPELLEDTQQVTVPSVVPMPSKPVPDIVFHEARTIVRMYDLDPSAEIYQITMFGTKYHRAGCYMLEKNFAYTYDVNLDVAIKEGYAPCKVCCRGMPEPDIERESFYRP